MATSHQRGAAMSKTNAAYRHQDFPRAIRNSSALVHSPSKGWAASSSVPRAGKRGRAGAQDHEHRRGARIPQRS